jgi:hypothetical protein
LPRLAACNPHLTGKVREIINYEGRRKVGKSIGSGRMEKGVDLVVGHRQKKGYKLEH